MQPSATMSGDHANILVAVRVRPENDMETKREDLYTMIKVLDDHVLAFDPITEDRVKRTLVSSSDKKNAVKKTARDVQYAFDRIFSPQATQEDVYLATAKPLLTHLFEGYNATVFAYGATGAGKTYTMLGTHDTPGVMVLTMQALFLQAQAHRENAHVTLSISYFEIYNETIRDLLSEQPSPPLDLREDPEKGMLIAGLTEHQPTDANHVLQLLDQGNARRSQSPTEANAQSSRSHAVLQIRLDIRDHCTGFHSTVRSSKLSLIDLAGSERAAMTKNRGDRLIEGANINRSLLALGNCINALGGASASSARARKHIPYRDSKLTRLLKDSLGGRCRTVMICNISPSSYSAEDTHNTLKYANRAKNIRVHAKRNVHSVQHHVSQYTEIIADLHRQVDELKAKLLSTSTATVVVTGTPKKRKTNSPTPETENDTLSSNAYCAALKRQLSLRMERQRLNHVHQTLHLLIQSGQLVKTAIGSTLTETLSRMDAQLHDADALVEKLRREMNESVHLLSEETRLCQRLSLATAENAIYRELCDSMCAATALPPSLHTLLSSSVSDTVDEGLSAATIVKSPATTPRRPLGIGDARRTTTKMVVSPVVQEMIKSRLRERQEQENRAVQTPVRGANARWLEEEEEEDKKERGMEEASPLTTLIHRATEWQLEGDAM